MKRSLLERGSTLLLAFFLALPFPALAQDGAKSPDAKSPKVDIWNTDADVVGAKGPATAPTDAGTSAKAPVSAVDGPRTPVDEREQRLERAIADLRRQAASLRTQMDDLKELKKRDPAEFDRRVRAEHAALDARNRPDYGGLDGELRRAVSGADAAPAAAKSPTTSREGRTPESSKAPGAAREEGRIPDSSRKSDGAPVPGQVPVDDEGRVLDEGRAPSRSGRTPDVGRREPLPSDSRIPTDPNGRPLPRSTDPYGRPVPGPRDPYGRPVTDPVPTDRRPVPVDSTTRATSDSTMPWWQSFLLKLLDLCGQGLARLFGRKMGEIDDTREAIVRREVGDDPVRRAAVDARLRGAVDDGLRTREIGAPDAELRRPVVESPPSGRARESVGRTSPRRSVDPSTGLERVTVDWPLGEPPG